MARVSHLFLKSSVLIPHTQCKKQKWNRKACQRFKVKPIKLQKDTMPELTDALGNIQVFSLCGIACVHARHVGRGVNL